MEQNKVNIEVVSIDDLIQDDHNFNKGNEQGQQLMERSFKELGAGRSILLDRNGNIIAGNKSQKAAIAAGIKKVRVIETTGDELVAVKRTDVDIDSAEGRKMAYLDNLTTQVNLTWDQTELEAVQADVEGFDIADFGVDLGFPTADPDEADKVTEDDFDEEKEPVETICKPGDLWQLGNHRLMCGDSTKKEDVAKLMQGELAHLWLTDPPYNVAVKNSQGMTIANDNMASDEFRIFLRNAFAAAYPVLDKGCPFYIWFASKEHINFEGALNDVGLQVRQELIWNKNHFILGRAHYQWKHEPCLYGWKGDSCRYFIDVRNRASVIEDDTEIDIDKMKKADMQKLLHDILDNSTPTTVINCMKPNKDENHPTMKPVRLFGYQMANSSRPGDIILDSFGGSGTTIVAAEQLGRKARLMEYDPHYSDVIIARWEKLTGQKAVKLNP
jgi:site-specific DNA-methyltransferase (adenine-specific)